MYNHFEQNTLYQADKAYDLRPFAQSKRYLVDEITAYTVSKHDSGRAEVEAFIHAVFKQTYQASITHFLPKLVALRDNNGILMAAFGLRNAAESALFLEQYIDQPIEQLISTKLSRSITRKEITCIGNLAVANPRNAGVLIAHVVKHSLDIGIEWCVATAHHSLQNGLVKAGRDVYALTAANPHQLPSDEILKWGSYYHQIPQIIAVRGVAPAL